MGFSFGIIGLPNVGKSTLFNAITSSELAKAANHPFCTVDPNIGIVAVPDLRLLKLAQIANSQKIIPTNIEVHDIAGLVKGASRGAGLGNKFLGNIRTVNAIAHVLRCFEDDDITHVDGTTDPIKDAETVKLELILSDIESLERKIQNMEKKAKQEKSVAECLSLVKQILEVLNQGKFAYHLLNKTNKKDIDGLQLLTGKPFFYISNVCENDIINGNKYTKLVDQLAKDENSKNIIVSAKIESEIANLTNIEEKNIFLESIGLKETESALYKVIRCGYDMLDLMTFFTIGPKEAHAWNAKLGVMAPQAAGVIHTDFEQGFICAEITSYKDYLECSSEQKAKELGKMRLEGKNYVMQDGDIAHFRFNKTK